MAKRKSSGKKNAKALMRDLFARMEAAPDAQSLNDDVIIPFAAALEEVCEARGYILNIFGEKSNIVFSGDDADAKAINPFMVLNELESGLNNHSLINDEERKKKLKSLVAQCVAVFTQLKLYNRLHMMREWIENMLFTTRAMKRFREIPFFLHQCLSDTR